MIQQVDEPTHLYEHPGNTFVAGFIGSPSITLMDGGVSLEEGRAVIGGEGHTVDLGIERELATRAKGPPGDRRRTPGGLGHRRQLGESGPPTRSPLRAGLIEHLARRRSSTAMRS